MPGATRLHTISLFATFLLLITLALPAQAQIRLDLPAQPLGASLTAIGTLAHLNVMFDPSVVDGLQAPALKAELNADDALGKLLSGTKLHAVRVDANTVRVISKSAPTRAQSTSTSDTSAVYGYPSVHLASAGASTQANAELPDDQRPPSGASSATAGSAQHNTHRSDLEEVTITGTNIHGAQNPASPVQIYTRDDIDRTGLGTVKDFIQRLPQNFNGVANEGTNSSIAGGPASGQNVSAGSAVNLRGLGPGATLLLVDGHRVAPGNVNGNWFDISLIPLAAVERIEVLTDGASAVYGSDAVGGVVNLIMRKQYVGAETRARIGTATEGGGREIQASQTLGQEWTGGSAVLTYEYFDRTAVYADQRSFTDQAPEPTTLLPQQLRHSAFLSAQQKIGEQFIGFGEASYSRRTGVTANTSSDGFSSYYNPTALTYSGTLGARMELPQDNTFELSSTFARGITQVQYIDHFSSVLIPVPMDNTSTSTTTVDGKLDGTLWTIPSGAVRYAIGGQYRRETFQTTGNNSSAANIFNLARHIYAGFLELNIPLVGPEPQNVANRLELSLAVRSEKYSDFGSSTNPKVGIAWQPIEGLKARATFGTSFQAPALWALNPTPYTTFIFPESDPLTGGATNALLVGGGNPNLTAEKATTWSAGIDFLPEYVPGFKGSLTYYDVKFKNQITDALSAGYSVFNALAIESTLGPSIVRRNPSVAELQELIASSASFTDLTGTPGGAPLSSIGAIVDNRELNLSTLRTRGVELQMSYAFNWNVLRMESGIDGTGILKYDQQLLPTSSLMSFLNTPYNPNKIRLRAREIATWENWIFAAFVNYTNSYTDNRTSPSKPVASWTTEDVTLGYNVGSRPDWLRGFSALFSITNLTNARPPFVLGSQAVTFPGINFDATNANPLGRLISLQITKRF